MSAPRGTTGGGGSPFVIAHRAGNELDNLRAAESLGIRVVEADVHLFRGRLESRHLKTVGPIPVLWDRWRLANPFAPRLLLDELLAAKGEATELMLDLKGRDPELSGRVLAALQPSLGISQTTICSRNWALLDPFASASGVRVVYSVGSRRQLRDILRLGDGRRLHGISIHERFLDPPTVTELRRRADVVLSWPANTLARARELAAFGVDGLITEQLDLGEKLGLSGHSP